MKMKNIHFGEFPKWSDEIIQAARLVKKKLSEKINPCEVAVLAPADYFEIMVSTFEDAGIPVYFNFSLPLKGTRYPMVWKPF